MTTTNDENKLVKAIDDLMQDSSKLSETAKLRNILPHIEKAREMGYTLAAIHGALTKDGTLKIPLKSFIVTLNRIKKASSLEGKKTKNEPLKENNNEMNPLTKPKGFVWKPGKKKDEDLI